MKIKRAYLVRKEAQNIRPGYTRTGTYSLDFCLVFVFRSSLSVTVSGLPARVCWCAFRTQYDGMALRCLLPCYLDCDVPVLYYSRTHPL